MDAVRLLPMVALPPGEYQVITDEELIEGLSFPVYRRVSTMILVPVQSDRTSSVEMLIIAPPDLRAAQDRDAAIDGANLVVEPKSANRSL